MNGYFELWDVKLGNLLGTFDSEEEALAQVAILAADLDPGIADGLSLSWTSEKGEWRKIADGARLAARAAERASLVGSAHPLELPVESE